MLPAKVCAAVRRLLHKRVDRLVRSLEDPRISDSVVADNARLVGEAGWMLDPEAVASSLIVQREDEARRYARVCVWDGVCEADATSDDGLCADHAAEQALEDLKTSALIERGDLVP